MINWPATAPNLMHSFILFETLMPSQKLGCPDNASKYSKEYICFSNQMVQELKPGKAILPFLIGKENI